MSILKGTIYITDREDIIYNLDLNGNTRVVNLDEDGILMENNAIIGGTCLLPPIEAKIAEADNNEVLYDTIYTNHLLEPYQQKFIGALLSYLYIGGNLIIFLPELGYTNTKEKFIKLMYDRYGIHIGMIGSQDPNLASCFYDDRCIIIWLNLIYFVNGMSARDYLYLYPLDAPLENKAILERLVDEISPYCKTYAEKINYIIEFHQKIHQYPNIRPAIIGVRRN